MKDLVVHKLHEIGDNLTPKKVLQKALPFLVDQIVTRVTGDGTLGKMASDEIADYITDKIR